MRKKTAEFQSFFIVIAFVLMTSNVIKSFVQRRNVRRFSLSSGPLQSLHHISSHTANRKHFSSSIDSNDVMSYLNHPPNEHEIHALSSFLSNKRNVCVITGAGVSTSSGIPDYRGPQGSYKLGHKPMVHQDFVRSEAARKRYWARSMLGWQTFSQARPNGAHISLAKLELQGIVGTVITQNVDRLHQKAGSVAVIDLHGRNDRVSCLSCGITVSRRIIQQHIDLLNPTFRARIDAEVKQSGLARVLRADGDAELGGVLEDLSSFVVPCCSRCGSSGIMKPDVVFFGDNVPKPVVQDTFDRVEKSDGVMILGTSLEVYSAYRFVERASSLGLPMCIVNMGETRAERMGVSVVFKSDANCAELLTAVVQGLDE